MGGPQSVLPLFSGARKREVISLLGDVSGNKGEEQWGLWGAGSAHPSKEWRLVPSKGGRWEGSRPNITRCSGFGVLGGCCFFSKRSQKLGFLKSKVSQFLNVVKIALRFCEELDIRG